MGGIVIERMPENMPLGVAGRLAITDWSNGPEHPITLAVMPKDVEEALGTEAAVALLAKACPTASIDNSHVHQGGS